VIVGPDLTSNGDSDAFVAKVNAAGTALVYCGYIGGSGSDAAYGISVDGSGNAYVTGNTSSSEATFPVAVGPDLTQNGDNDAFVAKVNAAGTALVYCGYIGGSSADYGSGIAVDGSGNSYVTGYTDSTEASFPGKVGPDLTFNGGTHDVFVAKVSTTGGSLVYCGYIGGSSDDHGFGIAVDGSGNAYVTGATASTQATFPATVGPDLTSNGDSDAFVAKVNAAGTALVYCGYIGGSSADYGYGIAVDGSGNAYVIGLTLSDQATFPVKVGPDLTFNGGTYDAFVAKVSTTGGSLVYCGYIGGSDAESGRGIAVDASGNAHVTGVTFSTQATFPVIVGPDLTFNGGTYDAFVAKVNAAGTALVYCGYIGGSSDDYGYGIALDRSGNTYVTGYTSSTEATFPVAVGPDVTQNGSFDSFVAKLYYFEQPVHKHAVGDFDGDGADEVVMDFGSSGAWMWNGGAWSQLTTNNPENMIPFDFDGNGDKEIALDLGSLGLWMWNGGVWSQLSVNNPEYMIAADTNDNGIEELIIDFGAAGLGWRREGGLWYGMTPYDPQNIIAVDIDHNGKDEVVADFGKVGMWLWEAAGSTWQLLTAADPNTMTGVDAFGFGNEGVAAGLGGLGTWLWDGGMWGQLSGITPDNVISGNMLLGGGEEIAGDFGLLGVWLWGGSVWTELSGVNAEDMIAADVDGNGVDEVIGDFGVLGLWLWNSGTWSQLSGVNPEGLLAGDFDGDGAKELVVDFGSLGVWMWNSGTWSKISALNPD
jgi:hypothetical protein